MQKVRIPDSQHVELECLRKAVDDFIELNDLDPKELYFLWDEEPESVVFTQDYLEENYGNDWDMAMETVMAVGERDLDNKIRYWRHILNNMNEGMYNGE